MKTMRLIPVFVFSAALVFSIGCKKDSGSNLSREQEQWVAKTLNSMSAEEKVGQLLAPAIAPPRDDSDPLPLEKVAEWIDKYHIGHVYLASNRMDPVRTARYVNNLQAESEIPLLIHSDLETGPGDRFDGGTILPPLMGIAQTMSDSLAYMAASITAKEARAMGIHLINSPVLDVNINPDNPVICIRSFGDNPELVTRMGKAYLKGLNEYNLIGAAKHFPGHGDVSVDSHSKMPAITASRERLDSIEFHPYKEIIPAGLRSVMTAHISIPALDPTPGLPATMSEPILTGVLRKELCFDGLIITDAFDMGSILESGTFEESAVQSIIAGNDIVLLWTNPRFETVFPYVLKAVEDGRIPQSRLDESVRRILIEKARVGLYKEKLVDLDKVRLTVDTPEHREKAREIYEKSIVLVRNEGNILPLPVKGKKIAVLSVNDDKNHLSIGQTFIDETNKKGNVIMAFSLDPETSEEELNKTLKQVQEADIVVVGLFARIFARRGSAALINKGLIQFLEELSISGPPLFVVSFGSPYLISQIPEADGYMISTEPTWDFYGYNKHRPGQIAAAKAIFGKIDIKGKLAVSIPELYPFGHGLEFRKAGSTIATSGFEKTPYPRIGMLWRAVRGESGVESTAKHDLIMSGQHFLGLVPNQQPAGLADAYTRESVKDARERIRQIKKINPDAVIMADLLFYEYWDEMLPEDHPWWLRVDGNRQQFWPGTHRMDWNNKGYRLNVIKQTLSLKECGVDGVFYDNIRNEPEPWVAFLTELREAVGDEFLIFANAGYDVGTYNFAYPYINGVMYESGWSHNRTEWDEVIEQMQYSQSLLREPNISLIERFEETRDRAGWPADSDRGQKPKADPAARRWSLCFALTIGDFYYLFSDNTSHAHDWYPEYDTKIGLPTEEGKRISSHVWTRNYEKALVIVNLPGSKQDYKVKLKHPLRDSFTGEQGTHFEVPPGDGRILLLH